MGKEGDLWDDSALINAFDEAISTYKIMHGSKDKDTSTEAGKVNGSTGENDSNEDFENPPNGRDAFEGRDASEESNVLSANASGVGETVNVSFSEENNHLVSHAAQPCLDTTSGQNMKETLVAHNNYPYEQGFDDYNQLLGEYYAIEEKRKKILEQLNQYNDWNYQYSADVSNSGVQYCNSQEYPVSACQVSHPNVVCSCCTCFSQCCLAPCMPVHSCSLGGSCVAKSCNDASLAMGPERLSPSEDSKILKVAMGAAERAMSTIKTTISSDSNTKGGKEAEHHCELDQCNGSETDLTVVLNAWYSAGFHTGKYLTEQSIPNRRGR